MKNKKIILIIILILIGWGVYKLYQCNSISKDFLSGYLDGNDHEQSLCEIWKKVGLKREEIKSKDIHEDWNIATGTYEFSEFAPGNPGSNQTWAYTLNISNYKDENSEIQYKIALDIDGFQTKVSVLADGKLNSDNSMDAVFYAYSKDHSFPNIPNLKAGDTLFSLTKNTGGLLNIKWKAIQPMLTENKDNATFKQIYSFE